MLDWYILTGALIFTNTVQAYIIGRLYRKCTNLEIKCNIYESALNKIKDNGGANNEMYY